MRETMHAIEITGPGGPEVLAVRTLPIPRPGPDEVLIRVRAAGINHADLMQREGSYPPPPGASPILGLEVAGEVIECGETGDRRNTGNYGKNSPGADAAGSTSSEAGPGNASGGSQVHPQSPGGRWRVGDAVCALLAGGGYAEYCVAPAGQCMPIPEGMAPADAAAIPEAAFTVWANLFEPRRLHSGDLFLVQGGSSGIGAMAIQIARQFGARVAATAGSDEKCRFALSLGAEKAVNYRAQKPSLDRQDEDQSQKDQAGHASPIAGWAGELASWAKPHGIDVILDMVGGDYVAKHLALLAPGGRLVHIAHLRGSQATIDLTVVMRKRLLITGSTLRSRPLAEKAALASSVEQNLWPLFAAKRLHATVFRTFPLAQAAEAHRFMESGQHMGKLVLTVD